MTENTTNNPTLPENLTPPVVSEPGKIQDHFDLFQTDPYQETFEFKRQFEGAHSKEEVARIAEWTKTWDYREKNFAREALTVNPAKDRFEINRSGLESYLALKLQEVSDFLEGSDYL